MNKQFQNNNWWWQSNSVENSVGAMLYFDFLMK